MVVQNYSPKCAKCNIKKCRDGQDCFNFKDLSKSKYEDPEIKKILEVSTKIEGIYYCELPRLAEIIKFSKEMGYKKLGLAFCVGLEVEAKEIERILSKDFEVVSVCCKLCGINKKDYNLVQINKDKHEVMCNPAGQAELMNICHTEFNIICGLCVGHDSIFMKVSQAPVTTLITKDRVLAHNPVAAVNNRYVMKKYDF